MAPTDPAKDIRRFIVASVAGGLIEWYDLFIFGSLATVIAGQFFPASHPATALLLTLAIFAAGFFVRPLGVRIFGPQRDLSGRRAWLPLVLMGASTFAIGLIPGYPRLGFAAPLLMLLLRLLQGIALGAEYGGAVTFVAQHAPANRRGLYTSWIQTAPALGVLLSLGVVLLVRHGLDADPARSIDKFNAWGWRIPFLIALMLMVVSAYIRLRIQESPPALPIRKEKTPAAERSPESSSSTARKNGLLVFFGIAMGQGVVFYAGAFYTQSLLENLLDPDQFRAMLLLAVALSLPFLPLFGSWSDRVGRKWIMLGGLLLAVCTYPVLFHQLLTIPNTAGRAELTDRKEIVSTVAFIGKSKDMIRTATTLTYYEGGLVVTESRKDTVYADGRNAASRAVTVSSKVGAADFRKMTGILFLLLLSPALIYGPVAAYLAELSPARVRWLPYDIGIGVIGGITPLAATLLPILTGGNILTGLWYPLGIAAASLVIGAFYLPARPPLKA